MSVKSRERISPRLRSEALAPSLKEAFARPLAKRGASARLSSPLQMFRGARELHHFLKSGRHGVLVYRRVQRVALIEDAY